MEEKELFEEIKPLIEEYKEYTNQKMPDVWNDSRASFISKVQDKSYEADREGEILKILDDGKIYDKKIDDVITIPLNTRRELIEELTRDKRCKKTRNA